ncbi:unnamed protein product [marine sediment metagenome]|uniref:Uncharacterized protein n=1 Tax=marine sediment metagenome TaxID=412755 RepID=X1FA37_9ZZZZ
MRLFIKRGTQDKLINQAKDGGGFQTIEVMVANNFELAVPEPERKDWIELYPGWDYRALKADALQCGVLMGLIMKALPQTRSLLHSVWEQLMAIRKSAEEDAGVKKEILPGGLIQLTDAAGIIIIREPYSYEIEGN